MKKMLLVAAACLALAACAHDEKKPEDVGNVTRTEMKPDGSKVITESRSDYAYRVDATLKMAEAHKVKMTCPPDGCRFLSLEVPVNGGGEATQIPAQAAPPPSGWAVAVDRFFNLVDRAVPWVAGASVLRDAFHAASGKSVNIDNSNRSVNTDSSNRSRTYTDTSNRSTNTDNSNHSINNSQNRNCSTGAAAPGGAGTTAGSSGASGPATC